jgi:hypothetical protein
MEIIAIKDTKGSEGAKTNHYIFVEQGEEGQGIRGGFYVTKGTLVPDVFTIKIKSKKKEEEE